MSLGKRNTDNGQGHYCSENEMDEGNLPPSENEPDNVEYKRQAALVGKQGHFTAERADCKACNLEKLKSEWYTYDGTAEQKPAYKIHQGDCKTAENEPENISYQTHMSTTLLVSDWLCRMPAAPACGIAVAKCTPSLSKPLFPARKSATVSPLPYRCTSSGNLLIILYLQYSIRCTWQ